MNGIRIVRTGVTAVLAATLLTSCSDDQTGAAVPREWIGKTYRVSGAGWVAPDSAPSKVAQAIHAERAELDRTTGSDMQFLRYRDDMVTVSPYRGGSLIEIEDYRTGYHRHRQHLTYWPNPDSVSFRGGGPGEGK